MFRNKPHFAAALRDQAHASGPVLRQARFMAGVTRPFKREQSALLGFVFLVEVFGNRSGALESCDGSRAFGQYGRIRIQLLGSFHCYDRSSDFLGIF
jgi:hypothetical protein